MQRRAFFLLFVWSIASLLMAAAQVPTTAQPPANKTQIVILGTGNPNAVPETSGPSVAIVVNGAAYLVDCGPGVVRRAAAARRKGIAALAVMNIKVAFLTHLHSDHTVGLPDLILTPWVLGRKEPLELYGPRGLSEMTDHIEKAWAKDVDVRTNGLEHANTTGYQVHAHEIESGVVYKDKNVTVKAFLVPHGSWDQSFGYRFETADRTIIISGDTGPTDAIAKACNGCDVLLHEVYSEAHFPARTPGWQKYFRSFHTSTVELAREASAAKPGLLILYHQMYMREISNEEQLNRAWRELLDEVRQHYSGKVASARDLDVY
jgi:ribonuclease BN (tRNA processing enzyme)